VPLGQHFNSVGVIKALQSQVVSGAERLKTSIEIEIFCNPIDFSLNDALHFKWSMQQQVQGITKSSFPAS